MINVTWVDGMGNSWKVDESGLWVRAIGGSPNDWIEVDARERPDILLEAIKSTCQRVDGSNIIEFNRDGRTYRLEAVGLGCARLSRIEEDEDDEEGAEIVEPVASHLAAAHVGRLIDDYKGQIKDLRSWLGRGGHSRPDYANEDDDEEDGTDDRPRAILSPLPDSKRRASAERILMKLIETNPMSPDFIIEPRIAAMARAAVEAAAILDDAGEGEDEA